MKPIEEIINNGSLPEPEDDALGDALLEIKHNIKMDMYEEADEMMDAYNDLLEDDLFLPPKNPDGREPDEYDEIAEGAFDDNSVEYDEEIEADIKQTKLLNSIEKIQNLPDFLAKPFDENRSIYQYLDEEHPEIADKLDKRLAEVGEFFGIEIDLAPLKAQRRNVQRKKNVVQKPANELNVISEEPELENEPVIQKKEYYGFDKNIKAAPETSKEAEIRRKVPTFEDVIKADDTKRERIKEAAEVDRKWESQQAAFELEQAELENRNMRRHIQTTTSEAFNKFDSTKRLLHSDTAEFTRMKDSIAALNLAAAMAQQPLMQDVKFKNSLLEAYKASNAYRVKKMQDEHKPLNSDWHPTSTMGEARWNSALAIEELAKQYIPEMVNQYHNQAEKAAYEQGFTKDTKVADKVNAEYNKTLASLDNKAESVRRMSFAENAGSAVGNDKEQIENQLAKLIAIKAVGKMYQANAEAGIKEEIDNDTFLSEVIFTTGDIRHREDFQRMMKNNSAEELIAAAKQGNGKGLMVKLSDARKDLIDNPPAPEQREPAVNKKLKNDGPKLGSAN